MRASAAKAALRASIEAITPDSQAHARDVFGYLEEGGATETERSFDLEIAALTPSQLITQDVQVVTYELHVWYLDEAGIDDRIAEDCERLTDALTFGQVLAASGETDIQNVEIVGRFDVIPAEVEGMRLVQTQVDVRYRRTGV